MEHAMEPMMSAAAETLHARFVFITLFLAVGLFLGMVLFLELGWRFGVRQNDRYGQGSRAGVGVADAPVYALLALLIAFMFSGASSRFDTRRALVVQEVNAMGTAWLRIDLLPPEPRAEVRDAFRRYVDALLRSTADEGASSPLVTPPAVGRAQDDVWSRAVAACISQDGERARMLLLPSLNELFDAVDAERLARRIHPPRIIFVMLGLAALATALFTGYGMASAPKRNWMHVIGVAATIAVAAYVIVELEFPRLGLVRMTAMDQSLTELRASMR